MGIDSLLPTLKPVTVPGHLSNFSNKTAAIDTMSWLYKGAYACAYELAVGKPTNAYLIFVYRMLSLLKRWSITPIFCIDGRQVPAKARTLDRRKATRKREQDKGLEMLNSGNEPEAKKQFTRSLKITRKMIYRTVDMLHALELQVIIAPYEADSQIAYLCRNKIADFAITEDSDVICYNCPVAVFKLGMQGGCEVIDVASLRERRARKEKLGVDKMDILFSLSERDFTYACIMAGCDYMPSVKGMGLKKAIKYFERFKTVESVIRRMKVEPAFMNKVPDGYETAVKRIADLFLYQLVYDPRSKTMVTLHEVEDEEEFVAENRDRVGNWIPDIESFAKGILDIKTLREREVEAIDLKELLGANNIKREEMNSGFPSTQYLREAALAEIRKRQFSQPNLGGQNSGLKTSQVKAYSQVVVNNKKSVFNSEDGFFDHEEIPYEAFQEDDQDTPKKTMSDVPTLKFENKKDDIDDRIDFLFEICKEYSEGFHDKEEETKENYYKDDIPDFISDAQHNLSMSEDDFDRREKPVIPLKNLFGGGISPHKGGAGKLVDSFKKVNLMSQKIEEREDGGTKTPSQLSQIDANKMSLEKTPSESVNKHKRKLSDIELEEDEAVKNLSFKKVEEKKKPQEGQKKVKKQSLPDPKNQPKISIFLKK